MSTALLELYRHKTWATLQLIEFCAGLTDGQLDATAPGTYGSIRDTLRHLVRAEEGYFWRISGRRLSEALGDAPVALGELAGRIRRLGPEWEALAQDQAVADREVTTPDGWRQKAAIVMAQVIHHADDHRTHVLTVLGANGIEGPDIDVWNYADATGQVERVEPSKA
jgi:uncharacterized damage-inducible protein DinB